MDNCIKIRFQESYFIEEKSKRNNYCDKCNRKIRKEYFQFDGINWLVLDLKCWNKLRNEIWKESELNEE